MDTRAVAEVIDAFRVALERQGVRVDKLILFGSHASGEAREDSDIDLVVVSKDFRNIAFWDRLESLTEAIYSVWQPIEAVAKTPEEWDSGDSLVVQYARKGKVVFDRETSICL